MVSTRTVVAIIIGIAFFAFVFFTGWRGMLGFVIGIGTAAYLILSDNPQLNMAVEVIRKVTSQYGNKRNKV